MANTMTTYVKVGSLNEETHKKFVELFEKSGDQVSHFNTLYETDLEDIEREWMLENVGAKWINIECDDLEYHDTMELVLETAWTVPTEYLQKIVEIFINIEPEDFSTPDLTVFPNVALFHLATGRGSIVIPHKWSKKNIQKLLPFIRKYRPETMSTGPAFMKFIFDHNLTNDLSHFKRVVIGGALTESSSIKLKENVETSEGNLEKVVNLRPVTYNKIGSQTTELGLIAEEVATVYPEFVQYDENGEPVGVNYSRLTAALIGAVKELTQRIETLENNG
jgi:hypothetical protein